MIPRWIKRAAVALVVNEGLTPRQVAKREIAVPAGFHVPDGNGGKRPAFDGERRQIGDFVGWRQIYRWSGEPAVVQARAVLAEIVTEELKQFARENARAMAQEMGPMVRGVRVQKDKYGQVKKDGKLVLYETVPPAVQAQVWNVALALYRQMEGGPSQRVELSTPEGIQVEVTTETVEAKRKRLEEVQARIATLKAAREQG